MMKLQKGLDQVSLQLGQQSSAKPRYDQRSRRCYGCGKEGHFKRDCQSRRRLDNSQQYLNAQGSGHGANPRSYQR